MTRFYKLPLLRLPLLKLPLLKLPLFKLPLLLTLACFFLTVVPVVTAQESEEGFRPIFDGETLDGWEGDAENWRVEEGAIVGESTAENPLQGNNFLRWAAGEVDDFELKLKYRISGTERANSGIQFRSQQDDSGAFIGYQADIDKNGTFTGIVYDEKAGRGILVQRGQGMTITEDGTKEAAELEEGVDQQTASERVIAGVDFNGWNEYHIKACGNEITLTINGNVSSHLIDHQTDHADAAGLIGLQLHAGPPMKIEFKDIHLKRLPMANGKKVVFVAGTKSHGWGAHEHNAGCLLLADRLNSAATNDGLPVYATVYRNGWPTDPTAFDNADTVVIYCDGGGRHMLHQNGDQFEEIMDRGVGLVCIHYGVEVPKGPSGQRFLNWIGGYFETDWSVNPHWDAEFTEIPEHPVTQGVEPFTIRDEWYYHMRFAPEMTRVIPVLSALPPATTLERPDGAHSNNPHVRAAVLERKEVQHLAWAYERPDSGGRGFGFTGGHFHSAWAEDNLRTLVLNAIVWTADEDVPEGGVKSETPDQAELDSNQDFPKPENR
ncbi:MAG: family 16 glycoside hydrolase [Planctomycetota bacterium]